MKIVQSDNGHLWYIVDKDGKICKVYLERGLASLALRKLRREEG